MGRAPKGGGQGHPTGTSTPQPGHKNPCGSLNTPAFVWLRAAAWRLHRGARSRRVAGAPSAPSSYDAAAVLHFDCPRTPHHFYSSREGAFMRRSPDLEAPASRGGEVVSGGHLRLSGAGSKPPAAPSLKTFFVFFCLRLLLIWLRHLRLASASAAIARDPADAPRRTEPRSLVGICMRVVVTAPPPIGPVPRLRYLAPSTFGCICTPPSPHLRRSHAAARRTRRAGSRLTVA